MTEHKRTETKKRELGCLFLLKLIAAVRLYRMTECQASSSRSHHLHC